MMTEKFQISNTRRFLTNYILFFTNLYDTRDEYEKDIWDCRKIPGAKITENKSNYYLNFSDIPVEFRELVKKFIKFRTTNNSQGQCEADIMALRLFTNTFMLKSLHGKT
ncbi:integrase [Thermoanaerobacter ethanolicus JW 200]|nr:integrase [Thermoanaerobacter ethanolicus JW 200]